jgi:hypothetical protein
MINYLKKKISNNYYLSKIYTLYKYNFFIKKKLKRQLFDENIIFKEKKKQTIIFSLIETSHPINILLMLLGKFLQIRGYQVLILVCDQILHGCEIKSIKNISDKDPCFNCKFNQKKIIPFFKLPIIKLSSFKDKKMSYAINKALKKFKDNGYFFKTQDKYFYLNLHIKDSVTRYFYGNVGEKKFNKKINEVSMDHCNTSIFMHEVSKLLDQKYNPIAVVSTMSVYSSWYPLFNFFSKNGNRFKQISLTQYNLKAFIFNEFQLYPAFNRFKKFLDVRKNKNLNKNEKYIISKFIKKRFMGSSEIFTKDSYYKKNMKNLNKIKKILNIRADKKNIFLFTNVFWDVGLADRGLVFNTVLEWVFYTIDLLKNNSNYHLYIKPHPAEFKSSESLIGIEEIIRNKYKNSISNITFIKTDYKIKPYDLKPAIDLALVFNGTLNIEFMLQKVPVISCGISPTLGLRLNRELLNKSDYKKVLTNKNYDYTKFLVKNDNKLMLFAYFYFIKNSIPWKFTNFFYGENFKGFSFKSLKNLNKRDPLINHLVNCIVKGDKIVPENW